MRSRAALAGIVVSGTVLAGPVSCLCFGPDCEGDSASVTVRSGDGSWAAGVYEITITAAGRTFRCSATAPEDFAERNPVTCSPKLDASIAAEYDAGKFTGFHFVFDVPEEPESVTVVVERDGVELLDERRRFDYQTFEERSSVCGGDCRKANVKLTVGG